MPSLPPLSRFAVDSLTGCWLWQGPLDACGYGKHGSKLVHRLVYEAVTGTVPTELDHLCRQRACANPMHLEDVTHRENIDRGRGVAAVNLAKTHCPAGHPYDEENTLLRPPSHRFPRGARECRACRKVNSRERARRWRAKRKVA